MPLVWQLLSVPLLIGLNAFFVAAEYALVAIRSSQIESLRRGRSSRTADALARLKGDMSSAIGGIQVCITMTNLLLGWIGEPAMSSLLAMVLAPLDIVLPEAVSAVVATSLGFIVVTLLTVVLSELLPKAITLQHTFGIARLIARPILRIQQIIYPLVWIMNVLANGVSRLLGLGPVRIAEHAHTPDEIGIIAVEAGEAGALTPRQRSLIINTLTLGRKTAEQIMVPRVRVAYLDLHRSMDENRAVMDEYLYSRLPLCNGGLDHLLGVVYTKEFLAAYQEPSDSSVLQLIARPAFFVPMSVSLDRLLVIFREQRIHMVFLVDEHGGVEGMVTLTDVIDELIGEMHESTEPQPSQTDYAETGILGTIDGAFIIAGNMPLHELADHFHLSDWDYQTGVNTVAGLLCQKLGHVPQAGEQIETGPLRLRVIESDVRRVHRVEVTKMEE